ncbi:MAG: FAD-binding oxidoreductase [Thermoleophilaceae bacterium]
MQNAIQTIDVIGLEVAGLRHRIAGEVVTPQDANWDEARAAWNLAVDQRPAAVAVPESDHDVVEIVRFARDRGLQVAAQSTGHNAAPMEGALDQTVLVKMHKLRDVHVDPARRIARVGAGTIWIEAVEAAAEHGLATLAGSSPDVGIAGYSLGGGLSWIGRKYGLQANNVTAVEIVTADGELVRADKDNEPDLFWAVRGGGGNFGVVTALEFRLHPIREVYAGMLVFPQERSEEVLKAWRDLLPSLPDEMTTVGRVLNVPPLEEIPEPVRGRSLVVVEAIYLGDEAEGAEMIQPLRDLGPEMDTMATVPAPALSHLHMDPEHPVPGSGDTLLLTDLPDEAIDSMLAAAGPGSGSALLSVEIRQLGGAIARPSADHGALASIDAPFVMFAVGMTPTPEIKAAVETSLARVMDSLAGYDHGRAYLNFVEKPVETGRLFPPTVYRRLRQVKAQYDPRELFRANHPIAPAR